MINLQDTSRQSAEESLTYYHKRGNATQSVDMRHGEQLGPRYASALQDEAHLAVLTSG